MPVWSSVVGRWRWRVTFVKGRARRSFRSRSARSLAGDDQGVLLRPVGGESSRGEGSLCGRVPRARCLNPAAQPQRRRVRLRQARHPGAIRRKWTLERLLAAMRGWRDRYGRLRRRVTGRGRVRGSVGERRSSPGTSPEKSLVAVSGSRCDRPQNRAPRRSRAHVGRDRDARAVSRSGARRCPSVGSFKAKRRERPWRGVLRHSRSGDGGHPAPGARPGSSRAIGSRLHASARAVRLIRGLALTATGGNT